jgi:hypothetical protein
MIEVLNWNSDHWVLSITFALIASAAYTVPKMVDVIVTANAVNRMGR